MSKFVLIFTLLMLTAAAGVAGQTVAAAPVAITTDGARGGIEEIFLAKDDGTGRAGEAASSFFTTDVPIYCVVQFAAPRSATVKMVFVAVSVPGVRPETKVVTTSYKTREDQTRVNFTGKPYDKWNSGKYRVDIFIDGKIAANVPLDIRPASGSLDGAASFQPVVRSGQPVRTKRNLLPSP